VLALHSVEIVGSDVYVDADAVTDTDIDADLEIGVEVDKLTQTTTAAATDVNTNTNKSADGDDGVSAGKNTDAVRESVVQQIASAVLSSLPTINTHNDNSSSGSGRRVLLLPVTDLGLANRLRIIVSGIHVARHTQRDLLVLWIPSYSCFAQFEDLFDVSQFVNSYIDTHNDAFKLTVADIRVETVESALSNDATTGAIYAGVTLAMTNHKAEFDRLQRLRRTEDANTNTVYQPLYANAIKPPTTFFVDQEAVEDTRYHIIIIWSRSTHSLESTDCVSYEVSTRMLYDRLKPSFVVASILERNLEAVNRIKHMMFTQAPDNSGNIVNALKSSVLIGIHVRAHDSSYDWAVVPPHTNTRTESNEHTDGPSAETETNADAQNTSISNDNSVSALRFDESSPFQSYVDFMQTTKQANPNIFPYFLVASNSDSVKRDLVNIFASVDSSRHAHGDRVLTILATNSASRDMKINVQLATAEFFLLAMADVIVHAKGSSFAAQAALVNDVPLIDVSMLVLFVVYISSSFICMSVQMFTSSRGALYTVNSKTSAASLYCGNIDYQRFLTKPIIMLDPDTHAQHTRQQTEAPISESENQEVLMKLNIIDRLRSPRHIYTHRVCYDEVWEGRRMCTISLPMCVCSNPHYIPLKDRSLYSEKYLNNYVEALYLGAPPGSVKHTRTVSNDGEAVSNDMATTPTAIPTVMSSDNVYCYVHDVFAGYPMDKCIGVLLDSNGNSIT
jgi:biopolymer transport protein ExbD